MSVRELITESSVAWKLLNGIVCIYKPAGVHHIVTQKMLKAKIASGKL